MVSQVRQIAGSKFPKNSFITVAGTQAESGPSMLPPFSEASKAALEKAGSLFSRY
jgi:hypothetical protein